MTEPNPHAPRHLVIADLIVLRNVLGLTQDDIAKEVGVTTTSVTNWEGGRDDPSLDHLSKWAAALGARIGLVIDETLRAALAALIDSNQPTEKPASSRMHDCPHPRHCTRELTMTNSTVLTLDGSLDDWGTTPGAMRWVPPEVATVIRDAAARRCTHGRTGRATTDADHRREGRPVTNPTFRTPTLDLVASRRGVRVDSEAGWSAVVATTPEACDQLAEQFARMADWLRQHPELVERWDQLGELDYPADVSDNELPEALIRADERAQLAEAGRLLPADGGFEWAVQTPDGITLSEASEERAHEHAVAVGGTVLRRRVGSWQPVTAEATR
jgi:transcriptional regulator with XRE-family HTH domain